jgi:branched-chain amino acid transport system substrate-binding protein
MNTEEPKSKSAWQMVAAVCATVCIIGVLTIAFVGYAGRQPIRVGFVAQLTGVQAELGVQERNGAQMAVDEINAKGGIDGRLIELIVKDDKGTPEGAKTADRELVKAGVVAIIGHATSGQTMAGLTVTDPAHVQMISPTSSSSELSGKKDYFFRIAQSTDTRAEMFAQHIYLDRKIHGIALIYDADNATYSKDFLKSFMAKYKSLGGNVDAEDGFSSKAKPDFTALVTKLRASNPSGLFVAASDIDTALIAQRARLIGWQTPLFTTSWAQTEALINDGGKAVEGMEVELAMSLSAPTPEFLDFVKHWKTRYGSSPGFGSAQGYEAVKVLEVALQNTNGKAEGLPEALVSIKKFKGLSEAFTIDKYGDVKRPQYFGVIRNGKYLDI